MLLIATLIVKAQDEGLNNLKSHFQSFNYGGVISLSDTLLKNKKEFTPEKLVQIYLLRGISFYSMAKEDSARNNFI